MVENNTPNNNNLPNIPLNQTNLYDPNEPVGLYNAMFDNMGYNNNNNNAENEPVIRFGSTKTRRRPTKSLSKTQKAKKEKSYRRSLAQRQRERGIRAARSLKFQEREMEEEEEGEAEEESSNYTVPSYWYAVEYENHMFYIEKNTGKVQFDRPPDTNIVDGRYKSSWVYSNSFVTPKIGRKMSRLIEREKNRAIKAAYKEGKDLFEKQPKERFIIRLNKKDLITATKLMDLLDGNGADIKNIDIVWVGKTVRNSYYYRFSYGPSQDPYNYNSNNDWSDNAYGHYRFGRAPPKYCFNIYRKNILSFFDPNFPKKLYKAQASNRDYWYGDQFEECINWHSLKNYIQSLWHFQEELNRLKALRPIAMQKYRDLQMEGLKRAYTRFERKTGKDFPVNMQNLLESYMTDKKPVLQYYQQRDNLAHIDTNLFQKNKLNE